MAVRHRGGPSQHGLCKVQAWAESSTLSWWWETRLQCFGPPGSKRLGVQLSSKEHSENKLARTEAWRKQTGQDRNGVPVKTDPCDAAGTYHMVRVEAQPEPPPFYPFDVAVRPRDPNSHTTCLLLISSKHVLFRGFCPAFNSFICQFVN